MTAQNKDQLAQQVIFTVSKILAGNFAFEEALTLILKTMCDLMQWQSASFWKLDETRQVLHCEDFFSSVPCPSFEKLTRQLELEKGKGLPGSVWLTHLPQWLADVPEATNFPRAEAGRIDGLHAGFAFPISVGEKFIGVFEFFSNEIIQPDEELLQAFVVVGAELGQFFERHRYQQELARQAKLNDYAATIGSIVNKPDSLSAIIDQCAELTRSHLEVEQVHIRACSDSTPDCEIISASASAQGSHYQRALAPAINLALMQNNRLPCLINDIENSDWISDSAPLREAGIASIATLPILLDGGSLGTISIFARQLLQQTAIDACISATNYLGPCIARKNFEKRLVDSEKRFRIFADNVDQCLFISAPMLKKHYFVSQAFEKIWGLPVSELYVDPSLWSKSIVPEDLERVTAYADMLKGNEMPPITEIDYQITKPDGRRCWLRSQIFAVVDQLDGTYHICGSVSDITERKETEKRVSDFYLTVSHELRTPLTSIKGALLLLERRYAGELPEKCNALTVLARKECDRMIRLISDMLDIKKIEAGMLQLQLEPIDPLDIVTQTEAFLSNFASEHEVELKKEVRTTAQIFADKDRIIQVLTNLISNAVRFSSPKSSVTVTVEEAENMVRFSVLDHGTGISPDDQQKLFKVFQQLSSKQSRFKDGSGMGLAICKGIVDEHGGRIGVNSTEGMGSAFWFELPRHLTSGK